MSTPKNNPALEAALANVNAKFRTKIISQFIGLKGALSIGNDKLVGIEAGHLCETVLRLLQNEIAGTYIKFGTSIGNFADECRKIVSSSNTAVNESLRTIIPRALVFVYTIRNKRGIGHVGGDVDANRIDSITIAQSCDWIVCELIRSFHGLSLEEAQDLVDGLATRHLPDVCEVAGKKRILKQGLSYKEQVLIFCYQDIASAILVEDLFDWAEYSNFSLFKTNVLSVLHKERMIEYDKINQCVTISPLGIKEVEENILVK